MDKTPMEIEKELEQLRTQNAELVGACKPILERIKTLEELFSVAETSDDTERQANYTNLQKDISQLETALHSAEQQTEGDNNAE